MITIGQSLVAGLAARGVEVVFGIPGVHTIELYRGLSGSRIRHVTPRHEQGAGFMADGYARATGRPGVVFVITGPGLTNVLTPMAQARADSVPVLVVSSVNPEATIGRGHGYLHELPDQHAMAATVALRSIRIRTAADVGAALDEAWALFTGGRPGPVHIEVPRDVLAMPGLPASPATSVLPPVPQAAALSNAGVRIARAKAPVIIAGGGAVRAGTEILTLAERLDAPVVLTANGRGLLHGHRLCVPASPSLGAVRALLGASDCVLAIGTEIGETDFDMYATGAIPALPGLIRVDISAPGIAARDCAVGITGDAATVAAALAAVVPALGGDGALRAHAARLAARDEIGSAMAAQLAVVEAIRDALPGAMIVGDSTQPVYAGNLYFDHDRPGGWFNAATGYGALGFGIPAAIGAAIGRPDVPVVCLSGDGGAQFSLAEMMVAVQLCLPVTFVIWNNHGYREIADSMAAAGIEVIGCDPAPPDFMALARAFGMTYTRTNAEPGAVARAIGLRTDEPRMIEIAVD